MSTISTFWDNFKGNIAVVVAALAIMSVIGFLFIYPSADLPDLLQTFGLLSFQFLTGLGTSAVAVATYTKMANASAEKIVAQKSKDEITKP